MGNIITHDKANLTLALSNGATDVLIDVLLLATSDSAATNWERRFAVFLAEHDQHMFGLGLVSFDLDEIGWTPDGFEAQKQFVLRAIDMAAGEHRWGALSYTPGREIIQAKLDGLREMVRAFEVGHINVANTWQFDDGDYQPALCDRHRVYVWEGGCTMCHNE